MGVPESMTRRRHGTDPRALLVRVSPFFSRCASSQMTRSQLAGSFAKRSAWMRNVSYDTIITCAVFRGLRNRLTLLMTSARLDSQMGSVFTRPLSHLLHSSSQLLTRLVGHTMSARFAVGVPSRPWQSSVHSRVIPCRVFPRPMSSARMHPFPSKSRNPITHSNMNFTPSR